MRRNAMRILAVCFIAVALTACGKSEENKQKSETKNSNEDIHRAIEYINLVNLENFSNTRAGAGVSVDDIKETVNKIVTNSAELEKFKELINEGNDDAQLLMAYMHFWGIGVKKLNDAEYLILAHTYAKQGGATAQWWLGYLYDGNDDPIFKVPVDKEKSTEWYQKAAAQGHAKAQLALAIKYQNGSGVQADKAKSHDLFQKARDNLMKKFEQGDLLAAETLAHIYRGGLGVPVNDSEAIKWESKQKELYSARMEAYLRDRAYLAKVKEDAAEQKRAEAKRAKADANILTDIILGQTTPDKIAITHMNKRFEFNGQITSRGTEGNTTVVGIENRTALCYFTDREQRLAVSDIGRSCWKWTGTLTSVSGGVLIFDNCSFRPC